MLQVVQLRKVFDSNTINEKVALDNVSLSLAAGDFVALVGSNGSGKSTFLNTIAGVYPPDRGHIILDKQDVTMQPEHTRAGLIGRVFQNPLLGTAASMTVEENLVMALKRGQPRRLKMALNSKFRSLLKERLANLGLGLEKRLTTKVGLLSGGQRQALTLLMATLTKPRLLLLDEHTAALDPHTAKVVLYLTCQMVEKYQLTTIMVTHNLEQALKVGTRTVMMHEGHIVLDIKGAERQRMQITDLMRLFEENSGERLKSDRLLLA